MAESRILTFAEGVSTTAPAQTFITSSAIDAYASNADFVTAKGSAATEGDIFFNTTSLVLEFFDGTAWNSVTSLKDKLDATTAPTASDDDSQGYSIGSKWLDVTNERVYFATDVTTGAANWMLLAETKSNFTATVAPTANDDTTLDYKGR